MHKLKSRPPLTKPVNTHSEVKPAWLVAIEESNVDLLKKEVEGEDVNDLYWKGRAGALEVMGEWTPLAVAVFCDNGIAVDYLLRFGADPHLQFHRQGKSFSPYVYAKEFDKNYAYSAMELHRESLDRKGHH